MALKFRRGTTAQKSGSLAFGEPYVNTTLGTLQIGLDTGDISLSAVGTGSNLVIGGISGSSLDITGNAKIDGNLTLGGNITIGDATSDTVAVTANLSSSLIPSNDNAFDLGSSSKKYKDAYLAGNITVGGNVDGVDISVFNSNVNSTTASLNTSVSNINTFSGSTLTRLNALETDTNNLESTSASVNTSVTNLNSYTSSFAAASVTLTNKTISGASNTLSNIANASLSNSAITIAGTSTSLGGTISAAAIGNAIGAFSGSSQVSLSGFSTSNLSEGSNLYYTDARVKTKLDAETIVSGSAAAVKSFLSLGNVTNESKGTMFTSPTFTGTPVAPTAAANTNSTQIATTAYVQQELTDLIGGAAAAFDTLIEISASLASGDSTLNTLVDGKLAKSSNLSDLTDASAARTNLGLAIGTNVQAYNSTLAAVAGGTYSGDDSITTIGTVTAGSVTAILPAGTISGSAQVNLASVTGNTTSNVSEGSNQYYTDARVKTKLNTETVISGSSQVAHDSTTGYSANKHIDHTSVTITAGSGLSGGGDISATRTLSIATGGVTNAMLAGSIANDKLSNSAITIAGTSTSLGGTIALATITGNSGIVSGSSQLTTEFDSRYINTGADSVVSGSAQIAHDSTTGYDANKHIDHTAVSITAGTGLTGGGTIAANRTLAIDSTVATLTDIQTLTNKTISGASNTLSNIANASLSNSSVTVTAGSGMSGGGAVSLGGSVTLTNAGVTSNVAGTGVTVSGATGAVTISIGQSVATGASPTFAGLTINGSITATGDITAYYSSDKRFKDNIQIIPDALEKVKKLNGVTWEWNGEASDVTKAAPNTGLIAQEVQKVLPEVVKEREDGFLGLDYSKMMGLMVEAIKEQQNKIDILTIELIELKKQKGL